MFKILYHFVGEEGVLREIMWLNKDINSPKEELYEWQWLPFDSSLVKLKVSSVSDSMRQFEGGSLSYTHIDGTFLYLGRTYKLNRTK